MPIEISSTNRIARISLRNLTTAEGSSAPKIVRLNQPRIKIVRIVQRGDRGADGDSLGQPPPIGFAWNNVSPRVIYTLPVNAFIISVTVQIENAFDGIGATLSVGINGQSELLAAVNQINPAQIALYEISNSQFLSQGTQIEISTVPGAGATTGNGFLVIKFIRTV